MVVAAAADVNDDNGSTLPSLLSTTCRRCLVRERLFLIFLDALLNNPSLLEDDLSLTLLFKEPPSPPPFPSFPPSSPLTHPSIPVPSYSGWYARPRVVPSPPPFIVLRRLVVASGAHGDGAARVGRSLSDANGGRVRAYSRAIVGWDEDWWNAIVARGRWSAQSSADAPRATGVCHCDDDDDVDEAGREGCDLERDRCVRGTMDVPSGWAGLLGSSLCSWCSVRRSCCSWCHSRRP